MQVPNRIIAMQTRLAAMSGEVSLLEADLARLIADRVATVKRQQTLASLPSDPVEQVWCADLTEDLAGEVGTIEIPGEGSTKVIVAPGYEGAAAFEGRFGWLAHREGQRADQLYFNAALLPGWQKFQPTHRIGTISASTSGGTFSVQLDPTVSSAAGLNINQSSSLQGVPARYMQCDADAFETGDRVVVQFDDQDWTKPVIIGFEANPKPCATDLYAMNAQTSAVVRRTAKSLFETAVPVPIEFQTEATNPQMLVFGGKILTLYPFEGLLLIDGAPAPWQPEPYTPDMMFPAIVMCTHPTGIWVVERLLRTNVTRCTKIRWEGFAVEYQWTFEIDDWRLLGGYRCVATAERLYFSLIISPSGSAYLNHIKEFSNDGVEINSEYRTGILNIRGHMANHGNVALMGEFDANAFGTQIAARFLVVDLITGDVQRTIDVGVPPPVDGDQSIWYGLVGAITKDMIFILYRNQLPGPIQTKIDVLDRATGGLLTSIDSTASVYMFNQITVDGRLNALSL